MNITIGDYSVVYKIIKQNNGIGYRLPNCQKYTLTGKCYKKLSYR